MKFNKRVEQEIKELGRYIVSEISNCPDIPYTNLDKCKVFYIDWHVPKYAINKGNNIKCQIAKHSHICLNWNAKPKENSSIFWSNLKIIRTEALLAMIESIKRDLKIKEVLK